MKLKPGQHVKVGSKEYRVTRAKNSSIRCRVCNEHNKLIPCFNPDPITDSEHEWTVTICHNKLPANCYLYPMDTLSVSRK